MSTVSTLDQVDIEAGELHSDPHGASSRPRRLRNPLRAQVRWFSRLTVLFAALAGVFVPLGISAVSQADPGPSGMILFFAGIGSGTVTLILGFALCCLVWFVKRYDRDLIELEQGGALVHWTYTEEEWDRFVEAEVDEASRIMMWTLLPFAAASLVVGLIAAWNGAVLTGSDVLLVLVITSGGALMGLACGSLAQTIAMHRCRRWKAGIGETLMGQNGLYFAGDYYPWSMLGQRLDGVALDADRTPPVLVFNYRTQTNNGSTCQAVNVPIPAGREEVAERIAMRLTSL